MEWGRKTRNRVEGTAQVTEDGGRSGEEVEREIRSSGRTEGDQRVQEEKAEIRQWESVRKLGISFPQ